MFYDKDLMNSRSLGVVWRAANNISYDSDEEVSMNNICDKLDSWVDSKYEEPHRRLALRTSAALVDGAAKLYKRKMELLFDDVERLERDIAFPKRPRLLSDDNDSTSSKGNVGIVSTSESSTANESVSDDSSYSNENCSKNSDLTDDSSVINNQPVREVPHSNSKEDKQIQTDLEGSSQTDGFDRTLPFGFVVIHDNWKSRIPSRIIISSINPDVMKLV